MLVELTEEQRDALVRSADRSLNTAFRDGYEKKRLEGARNRLQMNLKFPVEFSQTELDELYSATNESIKRYDEKLADPSRCSSF